MTAALTSPLARPPRSPKARGETQSAAQLPAWRLHLLRAGYLLLVLGLGPLVWPSLVHHPAGIGLAQGVLRAVLSALSALAGLGLIWPLAMLPLLYFELAWKALWLTFVALPLWRAGLMDANAAETARECLLAGIFLVVIPWEGVFARRGQATKSGS